MKTKKIKFRGIEGNLQVTCHCEDGKPTVFLAGDPQGLMSLSRLASRLARFDQATLPSLPDSGATRAFDNRGHARFRPLLRGRGRRKRGVYLSRSRERRIGRSPP